MKMIVLQIIMRNLLTFERFFFLFTSLIYHCSYQLFTNKRKNSRFLLISLAMNCHCPYELKTKQT